MNHSSQYNIITMHLNLIILLIADVPIVWFGVTLLDLNDCFYFLISVFKINHFASSHLCTLSCYVKHEGLHTSATTIPRKSSCVISCCPSHLCSLLFYPPVPNFLLSMRDPRQCCETLISCLRTQHMSKPLPLSPLHFNTFPFKNNALGIIIWK